MITFQSLRQEDVLQNIVVVVVVTIISMVHNSPMIPSLRRDLRNVYNKGQKLYYQLKSTVKLTYLPTDLSSIS